jgi:hypothetical protein
MWSGESIFVDRLQSVQLILQATFHHPHVNSGSEAASQASDPDAYIYDARQIAEMSSPVSRSHSSFFSMWHGGHT